ncbi:GHKL domain-containing protein [Clostridium sp. MCC353]|uniref:sensor histidine kinase n=1 Tax=Clostridium sp. MCC353 TaxID=2592646 RepID=UPI001C02C875|nr:GHKL domain-containing protein [Clostridium sp. MCC353]
MNGLQRRELRMILPLILAAVLSMAFFALLYRYDNKYMAKTIQPMNGILLADVFFADEFPLTFLINGWEYYPDRLLEPTDLEDPALTPAEYIFIGQYGGMENSSADGLPHGSASYALTLLLPEEEQTYCLELPEIYSSYRLFVNGQLTAQKGVPDRASYQDKIQSGAVTFRASGLTSLLFAVSDWSHIYSGMVYPPAFGRQETVFRLLTGRFIWSLFLTILGILLAVFQFIGAAALKSRKALLCAFICLAFSGSVSSVLIHALFQCPVFPVYAVELFCRYAMAGLSVILAGEMYGVSKPVCTGAGIAAMAFPFAAFFLSAAAADLSVRQLYFFSSASRMYKAVTGIWIFLLSFASARKGLKESIWLATGACILSASLAADRIWPMFEPIRFGWFSEWAGWGFLFCLCVMVYFDSRRLYLSHLEMTQRARYLELRLEWDNVRYKALTGQMEEVHKIRHDIRHHLILMSGYIKTGRIEELESYITGLVQDQALTSPLSFCRVHSLDMVLGCYYMMAQKEEIRIQIYADLPDPLYPSDSDLCVILGNLLENAVEAVKKLPKEQRLINFQMFYENSSLMIEVSNRFDGPPPPIGGHPVSAKRKGRIGIGLDSVRAAARKYSGSLDLRSDEKGRLFTARVRLVNEKPQQM